MPIPACLADVATHAPYTFSAEAEFWALQGALADAVERLVSDPTNDNFDTVMVLRAYRRAAKRELDAHREADEIDRYFGRYD